MWINAQGQFYSGDCAAGDRAATAAELAPYTLAAAKAAKLQQIDTAYAAAIAAGLPYNAKTLQIDAASQQNISAMAVRAIGVVQAISGMTWPTGFAWRMADNSMMTIDAPTFLSMAQQASSRVTSLILQRGTMRDQVAAAADIASVSAVSTTFA